MATRSQEKEALKVQKPTVKPLGEQRPENHCTQITAFFPGSEWCKTDSIHKLLKSHGLGRGGFAIFANLRRSGPSRERRSPPEATLDHSNLEGSNRKRADGDKTDANGGEKGLNGEV